MMPSKRGFYFQANCSRRFLIGAHAGWDGDWGEISAVISIGPFYIQFGYRY